MEDKWKTAAEFLTEITVFSNPNNEPVTIYGNHESLRCIGVGTDAAVFQSLFAPDYAFKLYAKDKLSKLKAEANVYQILGSSPYFSVCFDANDQFLVLSYEEGITLFDCLLQGIHIPEQVIIDVENAREYVRKKGLNPRDIHLKNILLQNGRAKMLDISEYIHPGNDYRWEHLKIAYEDYYAIIDGKPIPYWLIETVRKWYHKRPKNHRSYDEFMKVILRFKNLFMKD